MSKEQYIVGLDIGTACVRVVQAKLDQATGSFSVIGASEVASSGMRRGVVVDIEESVSAISSALEKVERMTGVPVASANISVGGNHISSISSHGVIAVSRADGEITENDIIRCIDASQAISIPQNKEVLHVFPKTFTLDGQTGIKDPLGMTGIRLEVDTIIVQAGLPFVKNLSRSVMQAGLEIDDMVLAPCAAAESVLNKRQKDLGVCLVDLGAGTTSIAVYEEGDLLHTVVLPIGSMHITNDIAIGLRCSIETAEKVKLLYGHSDPKAIDKDEEIDLSKLDPSEDQATSRAYVAEIIEARLEEIFRHVNSELKKIQRDGKLPSGIVLTGGGSKLPGTVEFAKKHLHLPTVMGRPQNVSTVIDRVDDPNFATAVGLILWGGKFSSGGGNAQLGSMVKSFMSNENVAKLRKWLKSFLP
ncbi:MAG: cell division protein FtsA [Candidatus Doudnabacteria bacterium]|nr:cell division protein FtsA [Candidatus Doudnabacteria bacterium]